MPAPNQFASSLVSSRFAPLWLAAAAGAAYASSLGGPFVFDDLLSIPGNPTIRSLGAAWFPPTDAGITVAGRPLLNFTFALNWSIGGERVAGYHVLNLLIHVATGGLLGGLVRRTLRDHPQAAGIAWTAALLWLVHPLNTAAVTYLVQRAESLAALCIVAALYGFVRGVSGRAAWRAAAVAAAYAGVATKETAVVIPLLVLLYDRCFVSAGFAEALRRQKLFYAALASSWLLLAQLVATTGARGGSAGFASADAWHYALTQAGGILHYLRLAVWPHPLVFDYGTTLVRDLGQALPAVAAVVLLLAATVRLLQRAPRLGFLAAAFFLLLAPSSSIVPIATQALAEHRMYLPLASLTILCAAGLWRALPRHAWLVTLLAAAVLGSATFRRNLAYRHEAALWSDTVQREPENARAWGNLGFALARRGDFAAAIPHYRRALELEPDHPDVRNNLGNALAETGALGEALAVLIRAAALTPDDADVRNSLGRVRLLRGELAEAEREFRAALRLAPNYALAHTNLGQALAARGDAAGALAALEAAVRLAPADPAYRNNLANLLAALGRTAEAVTHYEAALAAAPADALTHFNYGNVLRQTGRLPEAMRHYESALAQRPDYVEAHVNLAAALQQAGRTADAVAHYEAALRLRPGDPIATENLRRLRAAGAP